MRRIKGESEKTENRKENNGISATDFSFGLEMRRRDALLISGVKRVVCCDGKRVVMVRRTGERTAVCGEALLCTVFADKTVEVRGKIAKIVFTGEEID